MRVLAARSIGSQTSLPMNADSAGFWLAVIVAGFAGFLAALFGAIRNGFDAGGAIRPALKLWLAACFLFLGMWAFALSRYPAPLPSAETQERAALFTH